MKKQYRGYTYIFLGFMLISSISSYASTCWTSSNSNNFHSLTEKKGSNFLHASYLSDIDWPMFHNTSNRTGAATMDGWVCNDQPEVITLNSPIGCSGFAISNWNLYFGCINGILRCVDSENYFSYWNYSTGGSIDSSPAVVNGRVYVGSNDSNIYCLNSSNGNLLWSYKTGGCVESSPLIQDNFLYEGSDDFHLYCLNVITGKPSWNFTTDGPVHSSPAFSGGFICAGSDDGKIYCLNATTGKQVWNYSTADQVRSSPAIVNRSVYVGSDDEKIYCLNETSGKQEWNYTTAGHVRSSPAIAWRHLIVGSDDGNVYCLNVTTGQQLWNCSTAGRIRSSPIIASPPLQSETNNFDDYSDLVYVGSDDCNDYCLSAVSGAVLWKYPTSDRVESSPVVSNSYVYIGCQDDHIYYFPSLLLASEPRNFQAFTGNKQVTLTWQAPQINYGAPIQGYEIIKGGPAQVNNSVYTFNWSLIVGKNVTSYVDNNVMNDQTYHYEILAITSFQPGFSSSLVFATPRSIPGYPLEILIGAIAIASLTIILAGKKKFMH